MGRSPHRPGKDEKSGTRHRKGSEGKIDGDGEPRKGEVGVGTGMRTGRAGLASPLSSASGTAPCGPAALPGSGCQSPESSCLGESSSCQRRAHSLEPQHGRQGARARSTEGKELEVWEMRVNPAKQLQGLREGQRDLEHDPAGPLASSPVMLSTSTCHLCSSCSSCRISRFWRRSATVSSGVEWGGKEGLSEVTSTLYCFSLFQQELPPPHCPHQGTLTMF